MTLRRPRSAALRVGGPILSAALFAAALTGASWAIGRARGDSDVPRAPREVRDAGLPSRFGPDGAIVAAPPDDDFRCRQPDVEIVRSEACERGAPYPRCRWQLPAPAADEYEIWRNTVPGHRWGRPGLVSLVLTVAAEYRRRWPDDRIAVGDLDAPGPRHRTHDRGVDVDLYLTRSMMARNEGGGHYPDNYVSRSAREVATMRARVLDFAKIIAACTAGQLRIYYNDPQIVGPFRTWFDARGYRSSVGLPMVPHNRLHTFHFHLTVAEDLAPLHAAD